jgi:hypothetical protein
MSYYERISMAKHEQPNLALSIYELLHNEYILNVFYLFFPDIVAEDLEIKLWFPTGI